MTQMYGLTAPKEVLRAVKLMIAGFVLGVVQLGLNFSFFINVRPLWIPVLVLLISCGLSWFLIYSVYRGFGIARVFYAAALVASLFQSANGLGGLLESSPFAASLAFVQAAVQLCAVFLLFRRTSAEWFAQVAKARVRAD